MTIMTIMCLVVTGGRVGRRKEKEREVGRKQPLGRVVGEG